MFRDSISITTKGRSTIDVTDHINRLVAKANITNGLCHLFLQHTSASLILCENYDPDVKLDLETFMSSLVQDGDSRFRHQMEGPDDMPAHIRSILTHNSITIPVADSKLMLGTWQGVVLWEHRLQGHERNIIISIN